MEQQKSFEEREAFDELLFVYGSIKLTSILYIYSSHP